MSTLSLRESRCLSRRFKRRHLVGGGIQPSRRGHLSVKFPGDSRREIRGALAEAAWNGHAQRRDAFIDQQEHGRCTPTAILLFRRLIRERIEEAESLRCESSESARYFNRHNLSTFFSFRIRHFFSCKGVDSLAKYLAKILRDTINEIM